MIQFSGNAALVQAAFHTTIHKYAVNGRENWANSSDPSIPAALTPAVAGIASLNNFPKQAAHRLGATVTRDKATGRLKAVNPQFTFPAGCQGATGTEVLRRNPVRSGDDLQHPAAVERRRDRLRPNHRDRF